MSAQTKKVLDAMPGTLIELSERTGYPIKHVLAFIVLARAEGNRIIVRQEAGVTVFTKENDDRTV